METAVFYLADRYVTLQFIFSVQYIVLQCRYDMHAPYLRPTQQKFFAIFYSFLVTA